MSNCPKSVFVLVCFLALSASAAPAAPVTKDTLRPPAGQLAKGAVVTFGQVFGKGDIKQWVTASAPGARFEEVPARAFSHAGK